MSLNILTPRLLSGERRQVEYVGVELVAHGKSCTYLKLDDCLSHRHEAGPKVNRMQCTARCTSVVPMFSNVSSFALSGGNFSIVRGNQHVHHYHNANERERKISKNWKTRLQLDVRVSICFLQTSAEIFFSSREFLWDESNSSKL